MENNTSKSQRLWSTLFERGAEADLFGQSLEATEAYEKLLQQINLAIPSMTGLSPEDLNTLSKLQLCLSLRLQVLKFNQASITVEEMQSLKPVFARLFQPQARTLNFPVDLSRFHSEIVTTASPASPLGPAATAAFADRTQRRPRPQATSGSLLPAPPPFVNGIGLVIQIEKIGHVGAEQFVDPFITITVAKKDGTVLEPAQDTFYAIQRTATHCIWNATAYIQSPIDKLPSDAAIYFEFKHYKPRKNKISTRCWALLELDEIKPGLAVCELYKKPTDFGRRRLRVLSKDLYLHLNLQLVIP
eukprot:GAFH01003175.1.p1 GENE.GAFH01003175.1~~GAFH01003175.1.p1  ORF type:complete len:302 (+),score=57.46 GAFH01003175.1:24-929(+)